MIDTVERLTQEIKKVYAADNAPIVRRLLIAGKINAALVYLEEITDGVVIGRDIIQSMMNAKIECSSNILQRLKDDILPLGGIKSINSVDQAVSVILEGDAVLVVEGYSEMLVLATRKWAKRSIEEPPTSSVIRGPREGFTEDLKTNMSMIRRRLKTPDLVFDILKVGKYSSTDIAIVYVSTIADSKIVESVKRKISKINIDGILDSTYVEAFLVNNRRSVFRQVGVTEKPDIAAGKMLEGRICVIVDGSPSVLTLPFLFIENFQDSGDYYGLTLRRNFLRGLRMISFLFAILLPGFYVSTLLFHYEMIPTDLLLTIVNARDGIPINPMLELIFTMILFEILQEASVRMPRHIGPAMSIVGALILGDTAVKAGIISSPAVMISAVSAITIYNVPDQADLINMLRFLFTILAGFIGFFGILAGVLGILLHLLSLNSFSVPYMAPYAPLYGNDKQDALFMKPVTQRFMRPEAIPTKNRIRMKHTK